jgi:hypothetical protein
MASADNHWINEGGPRQEPAPWAVLARDFAAPPGRRTRTPEEVYATRNPCQWLPGGPWLRRLARHGVSKPPARQGHLAPPGSPSRKWTSPPLFALFFLVLPATDDPCSSLRSASARPGTARVGRVLRPDQRPRAGRGAQDRAVPERVRGSGGYCGPTMTGRRRRCLSAGSARRTGRRAGPTALR